VEREKVQRVEVERRRRRRRRIRHPIDCSLLLLFLFFSLLVLFSQVLSPIGCSAATGSGVVAATPLRGSAALAAAWRRVGERGRGIFLFSSFLCVSIGFLFTFFVFRLLKKLSRVALARSAPSTSRVTMSARARLLKVSKKRQIALH